MKTNLSSQITLNRVSPRYYRPENAFERSVLTRLEKIPTDIYESPEEGANQIALDIAQVIRDKQKAGRFCILALAGGNSPRNVYSALVRMHKEEGLSFRNVVVFNLYEYYPLASDAVNSNLNALKEMLLDHVDIDMQNVFSPNGTIAKDTIFEYCRLYEQRIESFGGIDVAVLGIGRVGNIGFNEPGSRLNSTTRLILLDNDSRNEASKMFGSIESTPVSSITMGVATILSAKKVYLLAWGGRKSQNGERMCGRQCDGYNSCILPADAQQCPHRYRSFCRCQPDTYPASLAGDFLRMERQTDSQRHRLAVSADRKADFEVDQQRLQRKRLKRIACPLRFGI